MLYGDGTFDTSYYGLTVPYLYHLENEDSLGLFGIGIGAAFDMAKAIAGGDKPGGCSTTGPQQYTRDIMRRILTVNAAAYSKGLPIHEPTFTMLRAVASGDDRQGFDCPQLQAQAASFLAVYDRNRTGIYVPPPTAAAAAAGMAPATAAAIAAAAGIAPAPAAGQLPGWVVPAALVGVGVLVLPRLLGR